MEQDKLKNIISEEVNRVLEQEVARYELSLLENKFSQIGSPKLLISNYNLYF